MAAPYLVRRGADGAGAGDDDELEGAGSRSRMHDGHHRTTLLGRVDLPRPRRLTVLGICVTAAAVLLLLLLLLGSIALQRTVQKEEAEGSHRPHGLVHPFSAVRLAGSDISPALSAWTAFPTGHDDETARVQAMLGKQQSPDDCSTRKYFLWSTTKAGMGSALHMIGLVLGWAQQHNRTLLYHPNTAWLYTSGAVCGNVSTPDCFFFPLSRCQYMADRLTDAEIFLPPDESANSWGDKQFVHIWHANNVPQELVPSFPGIPPRNLSWWRAQTTRYIVRPRPKTAELVGRYFASNLLRYPRVPGWNSTKDMPPKSGICMHIRHGDKASEMTLHPSVEYMEAADAILRRDLEVGRNIFFSTDNHTVVQEVENGRYDRYNFTFYYTDYERRSDTMSSIDIARIIGGGDFGIISIANLVLGVHPHCRAFVQTTGSNWNRLRKTDGVRHDAEFVDLEPGEW